MKNKLPHVQPLLFSSVESRHGKIILTVQLYVLSLYTKQMRYSLCSSLCCPFQFFSYKHCLFSPFPSPGMIFQTKFWDQEQRSQNQVFVFFFPASVWDINSRRKDSCVGINLEILLMIDKIKQNMSRPSATTLIGSTDKINVFLSLS